MNTTFFKQATLATMIISAATLVGCGGGGGAAPQETDSNITDNGSVNNTSNTGNNSDTSNNTDRVTTVNGTVTKGPVNQASVRIFEANADGSRGELVAGPFTTTPEGNWKGEIPDSATAPFIVAATGGSYVDEASGDTVQIGDDELIGTILSKNSGGNINSAVTPLTHALTSSSIQTAGNNQNMKTTLQQNLEFMRSQLGFDPLSVLPPNPLDLPDDASDAEKQYAAILGGLSTVAQNTTLQNAAGGETFKLITALSEDMADGRMDGINALAGASIPIHKEGSNIQLLPKLGDDLSILVNSANNFISQQADKGYGDLTIPAELATAFIPSVSLPAAISNQSFNMKFNHIAGDAPYDNNEVIKLLFFATGPLIQGSNVIADKVSTGSNGEFIWTAQNGNTYTLFLNNGELHEINVHNAAGTLLGQLTPTTEAPETSVDNTTTNVNSGSGDYTLLINVTANGIAAPTTTINNVAKPENQEQFCADDQIKAALTGSSQQGASLTIDSCSFSGDSGEIKATMTITEPVTMTTSYSATYTYQ